MQTETTKPLYKVLNEKRISVITAKSWNKSNYYYNPIKGHFINSNDASIWINDQFQCNDSCMEAATEQAELENLKGVSLEILMDPEFEEQYTALAVNNLHHLAEAINTALKSTSSNDNDKIEIEFESLEGLQSALARIS